jgi:hypothetical protein
VQCAYYFADFCPQQKFFAGFYLYIINIAGRICEAAMGGAEVAQRPVLPVKDPKKTGARCARARTRGQEPLLQTYSSLFETSMKVKMLRNMFSVCRKSS